jgi:hypothetical protein
MDGHAARMGDMRSAYTILVEMLKERYYVGYLCVDRTTLKLILNE